MNRSASSFVIFFFLTACSVPEAENKVPPTEKDNSAILPDAPPPIVDSIHREFPNATVLHRLSDTLLEHIYSRYGITPDQILLGASTCVDDIIYTKNFKTHREIKGPFHLGGLAGIPFTGISGLSAFAHHIPENGVMVLEIAPHIGYSNGRGWGYVLRPGQHEASTCCGALMGTLQKLKEGALNQTEPTKEDYQGVMINNMAFEHEKEIVNHSDPLVVLTKITYEEAEKQILSQIQSVNIEHVNFIVIMGGVLINTDYEYSDYFSLQHFSVYDLKKKVMLENESYGTVK